MRVLLPLLLLVCTLGATAGDSDITALQDEGRLIIAASIAPDTDVVPGEKLKLTIEIATDTWFTGGTQIKIPEIPGLVILQTGKFAANSTERRGGATWVVQRWTLDVYPQRAGDFAIDSIPLQIKVGGGDAGNIEGTTTSPPVTFSAAVPQALQQADSWVAAPQFTVTQQFDRRLEELVPGDAFERTITFQGSDIMAMMLPTFEPEELSGLASYPAPPVLDNHNDRGEVWARRTQSVSYVVEAPGNYLLPGRDFFWWDTSSGELQLVSLPAAEISVAGSGSTSVSASSRRIEPRAIAMGAGGIALLGLLGWLLLKYRPWQFLPALTEPLGRSWVFLQSLRKPALPNRLNPGAHPRK